MIEIDKMIDYLQSQLDDLTKEIERFGLEDRIVKKKMDQLLGNKDMVEALIGQPVNLQQDGKVTIG